tara:strand:- start:38 stop:289 length:252 start_codon:yes stop_codon:yes gene_type:complete
MGMIEESIEKLNSLTKTQIQEFCSLNNIEHQVSMTKTELVATVQSWVDSSDKMKLGLIAAGCWEDPDGWKNLAMFWLEKNVEE